MIGPEREGGRKKKRERNKRGCERKSMREGMRGSERMRGGMKGRERESEKFTGNRERES